MDMLTLRNGDPALVVVCVWDYQQTLQRIPPALLHRIFDECGDILLDLSEIAESAPCPQANTCLVYLVNGDAVIADLVSGCSPNSLRASPASSSPPRLRV